VLELVGALTFVFGRDDFNVIEHKKYTFKKLCKLILEAGGVF